jgi:hypothetical protein
MAKRSDLDRLTRRWRERHDARRAGDEFRPRANPGREALARRGFPYHDVTPADYVAEHAAAMVGFTYDEESYADAELDAWIVDVGRLLREQREGPKPAEASAEEPPTSKPAGKKPAAKKPAAKKRTAKKSATDG